MGEMFRNSFPYCEKTIFVFVFFNHEDDESASHEKITGIGGKVLSGMLRLRASLVFLILRPKKAMLLCIPKYLYRVLTIVNAER